MLALDIGGTFIKYALTDESGTILPETVGQVPTNAEETMRTFLMCWRRLSSRRASGSHFIKPASVLQVPSTLTKA